jgi:nanoRNase/pAp phosphatase (c-di-AMP/oligoRNAs hydrolase)
MRCLVVCPDDFLFRLLRGASLPGESPLYLVEDSALRARIARRGLTAVAGDLADPATYRRAFRTGRETALVAAPHDRRDRILEALREAAPHAPLVVLKEDERALEPTVNGAITVSAAAIAERVLQPELERAALRARVERLRAHLAPAARLLIMVQDDPDPDAIASALALRALLGRNRASAPIASFGEVTRPENRALIRILEIEIEEIKAQAIDDYDMIAMVDVQPSFFEERFGMVDVVIDHHPEETPVRAHIKDVRPSYGSTSTIMTEYLRAAEVKITQKLATALIYGISSDTFHLERGGTRADMEAFAFLHPLANHNALRRIERPELPNEALEVLAHGIARRQLAQGVLFAHLGPITHPDLIPQFADLFLQVEGAEWSVVSGTVGGELHVSVRNVGYVRSAGEVVRQAFADLGSAGGHRAMAKAVIRLRDWRADVGEASSDAVRAAIVERFLRALNG